MDWKSALMLRLHTVLRFNPGDPAHGVRQVARVIGCANSEAGGGLVGLYSRTTTEDVRYVGKLEVAEAAKVIENVARHQHRTC